MNPVTKDVTSIVDYLRTNCVSDVSFVTQMAGELEINLDVSSSSERGRKEHGSSDGAEPVSKSKKRKLLKLELLKKITNSPTTTVPKLQKEIEKYRSITLSDDEILDFELLPWWCSHIGVFPILAKIARAVFAVPATAAHIERVWSSGGLTITSRRSRLSPHFVKYLLFCHENDRFCKGIISGLKLKCLKL